MSCDIFAVAWRSDDAIYEDYRYIKGRHISDFSKKSLKISYRVTSGLFSVAWSAVTRMVSLAALTILPSVMEEQAIIIRGGSN